MSDQNKICGSPGTDAPPCGSRDVASVEATAALTFKGTPGPWSHHADIGCKCGVIGSAEHPVATVTAGDWGDDYPSIRSIGGSIEGHFEAFIDQITYGNVPQEEADANARLIAAAPDLLASLMVFMRDECPIRVDNPFGPAVVEHWKEQKAQGHGSADDHLNALAAIAKALGGAS